MDRFKQHCRIFWFSFYILFSNIVISDELNDNHEYIDEEIKSIANDFISFRPMRGFSYQNITLEEAYFWQGEMAEYLGEKMGEVVGYKTGGHNVGPSFPTFPPEGIRGLILEGMILKSNSSVTVDSTVKGFLEADFAFRVRDKSINSAQSDYEILKGLDAIIPFAEIPDPYYEPGTRSIYGTVVSNMGSRFSFVGDPVLLNNNVDWLEKLNNFSFAVHNENNELIQKGEISGWYEPIKVVRWLRDHLISSNIELKAGDLLSLGNIGIIRQIHPNSPRGPAYKSDTFVLSYYGLSNEPASVTINLERSN